MTALGAKPNHGFFNCQHPAPGNPRARIPSPRRVAPPTLAIERKHGRARRTQASVPSNQNIFFSAVSCFTRETSSRKRHLRRPREGRPATHRPGDERCPDFFSSSGRFSALHNPDCAKLRKSFGAARRFSTRAGTTATRMRGHRCRHWRTHARRAIDARHRTCRRPCRPRADAPTTDERHASRNATGIRKRRSRPRFRGRLPDAPGLARCRGAISDRRLRAARRSRPG